MEGYIGGSDSFGYDTFGESITNLTDQFYVDMYLEDNFYPQPASGGNLSGSPTTGGSLTNGGSNTTIFAGSVGNDRVVGTAGDDLIGGGAGNDRLSGGFGSDILLGSSGNDLLNGGDGNDLIDAGQGNDRIKASFGDDLITLGQGKDTCGVIKGLGVTIIADFNDRKDRIDLPAGIQFSDLKITRQGSNCKISADGDVLAVLLNVRPNLITGADFT